MQKTHLEIETHTHTNKTYEKTEREVSSYNLIEMY